MVIRNNAFIDNHVLGMHIFLPQTDPRVGPPRSELGHARDECVGVGNRDIDLIISDRLPTQDGDDYRYPSQELGLEDWSSEPMFAAHAGSNYNPDALREHMEAGRLRAVTLQTPRHAMIVVGSDELDRIPSRAPFGPFSQ